MLMEWYLLRQLKVHSHIVYLRHVIHARLGCLGHKKYVFVTQTTILRNVKRPGVNVLLSRQFTLGYLNLALF